MMASALDPNREATLRARLDRKLAARKAERARVRSDAAKAGWRARRHDADQDPIMSPAAAARLRETLGIRAG